jgi:eukaryotic-like serine/threonine-protein kinase
MQEQVAWATGKPGVEDWLLSAESDTAAYLGHLTQAHDLSQRAVKSSQSDGANETAALWQMNEALRLAEFGYADKAQAAVSQALTLASEPDVRVLGALALARSGRVRQAQELSDALDKEFPLHFTMRAYWLPVIRASLALDQGSPVKALELLQAASPYELGSTEIFQIGTMYPVYLRGLAYLKTGQGEEAAGQFQNILDHPSVIVNFPLGSLAYLKEAQAKVLMLDHEGALRAYQDFFTLWKDADPDIPILKDAKAEYAKLQ